MSSQDLDAAVAYLKTLKNGRLPKPLFDEISRLVVLSTAELVLIKKCDDGSTQILLTQRTHDDKWWPLQWHVPGAVILASDHIRDPLDASDALHRVLGDEGEVQNIILDSEPVYAYSEFRHTKRGSEHTAVYYAFVSTDTIHDTLFDSNKLPDDIIDRHADTIQKVLEISQRSML